MASNNTVKYPKNIFDIPGLHSNNESERQKAIATIFNILGIDLKKATQNANSAVHSMYKTDQDLLIETVKDKHGLITNSGVLTFKGQYVNSRIKEAHQGRIDAAKRLEAAAVAAKRAMGVPPKLNTRKGTTQIAKWVEAQPHSGGKIRTRKHKLRGIPRKTRRHNKDIFHIFR